MPAFTPVIAIEVAGESCVYPLPRIAANVDAQGRWTTTCRGRTVRFTYREMRPNPAAVWVDGEGAAVRFVQSFWFAWQAMHPAPLRGESSGAGESGE